MKHNRREDAVAKATGVQAQAFAGRISWTTAREYFEKRPLSLALVALLTGGSPFVGLFLFGWPGVLVGLIVSTAAFFLGLRAITKVRDIERGS
jgi:hypothetical protein